MGADTGPDDLRRGPKADDEGVLLEAREVFFIGTQAASGGDDGFPALGEIGDDLALYLAKRRFALPGEYFRDGTTGALFDEIVGSNMVPDRQN